MFSFGVVLAHIATRRQPGVDGFLQRTAPQKFAIDFDALRCVYVCMRVRVCLPMCVVYLCVCLSVFVWLSALISVCVFVCVFLFL